MKTEKTIKKKSTTATAKAAAPARTASVSITTPAPAGGTLDAIPARNNTMQVTAPEAPVAKAVSKSVAPTREMKSEITSDLIAARAYIIWEQQGRPHGRDQENWLLAESQLKQEQSFTA